MRRSVPYQVARGAGFLPCRTVSTQPDHGSRKGSRPQDHRCRERRAEAIQEDLRRRIRQTAGVGILAVMDAPHADGVRVLDYFMEAGIAVVDLSADRIRAGRGEP